ncbi:MAG: hypothetical protein EOM90_13130 [Alphaproteobacteria bacterium]|nr:hypothetical protein [Alphaproteobacteria bacterium]
MGFKIQYRKEIAMAMEHQATGQPEMVTEEDKHHLPEVVKRYLRFVGCLGKPGVKNVFVAARGVMRSAPDAGWMKFRSEQHNFYPDLSRFFYIRAMKAGIPVAGLHVYREGKATMQIRLVSLFRVADAKGPEMDQGETVTLLNDMCFMAPATLTDPRIHWEEKGPLQAGATLTNGNLRVTGTLTFADDGRLIDFLSHDRFETTDGKKYINHPWRTPVVEYRASGEMILPYRADVIYIRPEGEFCYGKFELTTVKYNVG